MWRWYTGEDRRQAAAVVLLLLVVGLVLVATSPLLAGALLIMVGQRTLPPAVPAQGPTILVNLWRAHTDPAIAFGVLRMSPVIFWSLTGVIMVVISVSFVWFRPDDLPARRADRKPGSLGTPTSPETFRCQRAGSGPR